LLGTAAGGYEWVERDDPRVTEVRLLHELEIVGDVAPGPNAAENLLVVGDAYDALHALTRIPEYAEQLVGKVRLVYIDPPFNTRQAFAQYDDALEHSVWLTMMRDRLLLIRDLLTIDGSVWVHLDDAEVAYCRVLMDEIFGRDNFLASVIWKRRNDPRNTATHISADHDFVLVYAKDVSICEFEKLPRTEAMDAAYSNPDDDHRGPWRRGDLAARNFYSKGTYPVVTPSGRAISGPPSGSYWRVSEQELRRLDEDGRIYWGPDGGSRPYLKRFLSEVKTQTLGIG
jgi:adenine-specific DNA-methyltransferase